MRGVDLDNRLNLPKCKKHARILPIFVPIVFPSVSITAIIAVKYFQWC
jgi:hypothetical protein